MYVGSSVAPSLFPILRVGPQYGRVLMEEDCDLGRPVAVLSHAIWRDRFGRSPSVLGKTLQINRQPHAVVGVMPPGFGFPYRQDLWIPLCVEHLPAEQSSQLRLYTVGRLRPGVSLAEARAELELISERLASESQSDRLRARVEPYVDSVTDPNLKRALGVVGGGAGLLLFVACCTVALLLLLDGMRRQRDLAVKAALGASPAQISGDPLLTSVLISAMGGLVGLGIAQGCILLFNRLLAPSAYLRGFWVDIRLDAATLAVALAASVLAVPLCGSLPAFRAARTNPMLVLRRSASTGMQASAGWPGRVLVVGQIALSCVLLAGTAFTTRSALQAVRYHYGFDPTEVFTAKLSLYAIDGIDEKTSAEQAQIYFRVLYQVRELPRVREAAVSSALPTQVRALHAFVFPGEGGATERHFSRWLAVSPGFAATLGVSFVAGRDFAESDTSKSPPVVIVSRSFVERFRLGDSAVGQQVGLLRESEEAPTWATIVGVVGDYAMAAEGEEADPEALYQPLPQVGELGGALMYLLVRSPEPASLVDKLVSHEIRTVEPNLAFWEAEALTQVFRRRTWVAQAFTGLFWVFGLTATALSSAALYSIVALGVRRRRREIGIHVALGAQRRDIFWLVVKPGVVELAAGLLLGVVLALFAAERFSTVFESHPTDSLLLSVAVGALALIGGAALFPPAFHASQTDPVILIREDPEEAQVPPPERLRD